MASPADLAFDAALRFLRDGWASKLVPFSLDPDEYQAALRAAHWSFISDALRRAGLDPAEHEDEIADGIERANEAESAVTAATNRHPSRNGRAAGVGFRRQITAPKTASP